MAQLIKIQDYITRYEWDTFRYPTQYIRLKRESWDRLYERWSSPTRDMPSQEELYSEETADSILSKLKNKLLRKPVYSETVQEEESSETEALPETEQELKQEFLDNLLNFQMKWATSTVTHQSIVAKKYYSDPLLKYLLQRLPDTYLVMYHPIFSVRQVPVEGDIILITPVEIEVIQYVELEEDAVLMAGEERTWHVESPEGNRKILNPLISLKRTEKLVKSILATKDISLPVKRSVLSRTNPIYFASEPYQTQIIGSTNYIDWFNEKRSFQSPLKNIQIKAAQTLLRYCQSTSLKRPEWEKDGSGNAAIEEAEDI